MLENISGQKLIKNPEFQSALVRLGIWLFAMIYIGLGTVSSYFAVELAQYYQLFMGFLILFLGIFFSILIRPVWEARRYFTLVVDISATTFCILMTKEVVNPFYLLYIWIFISYGTRYGKRHLRAASLLSFTAYLSVLLYLDQWSLFTFDAVFFLISLLAIPMYQNMLLQKMHEARQEAEQANRAKSAFLSTMTHELRTPLNGIVGMSHLLKATPLTHDQEEYVQSIATSGSLLNSLIGNVLDLTRLETSQLELDEKRFSIRPLVREVSVALSDKAVTRGVEVLCDIDETIPDQLIGDSQRLKQILFSLLGNAVKFTEEGYVDLRVFPADDGRRMLRFEVEDTGIGIADEDLDKVFDQFWQADSSTSSMYDGAGLGTTLAKNLVNIMGGSIGMESHESLGSLFWFELPLLPEGEYQERELPQELTGKCCLLVELNPLSNERLTNTLHMRGVECRSIQKIPLLAEEITRAEEFDDVDFVVIADSPLRHDVMRLSGIIRDHLREDLPVIYLGYTERKSMDTHLRSLFLPKPVTREVLEEAVATVCAPIDAEMPLERGAVIGSEDHNPRVLMAEDNPINARVLSTLLKELGCEVEWAKNGDQALGMARGGQYDVAVVDLRMPKLDGIGFTKGWRASEKEGEHLPIIALTANTSSSIRRDCLDAGMDDFLAKPVDKLTLGSVIFSHLKAQRHAHTPVESRSQEALAPD